MAYPVVPCNVRACSTYDSRCIYCDEGCVYGLNMCMKHIVYDYTAYLVRQPNYPTSDGHIPDDQICTNCEVNKKAGIRSHRLWTGEESSVTYLELCKTCLAEAYPIRNNMPDQTFYRPCRIVDCEYGDMSDNGYCAKHIVTKWLNGSLY